MRGIVGGPPPRSMERRIREAVYGGRFVELGRGSGLWVYLGLKRDYALVEDSYCSCNYFLRSLKGESPGCKHLYALRVAKERGRYIVLDPIGESEAASIIMECVIASYARTLRLRLASREPGSPGGP